MDRRQFLAEFLGALGAIDIIWKDIKPTYISGIVIYELDDPEEIQDFIWHTKESDVPSSEVVKLVRLLNQDKLLDFDKIIPSREQLRDLFNSYNDSDFSHSEFSEVLEALFSIEVPMVDYGLETDVFFIHE